MFINMDTQKLFFVIEVAEKIFHGSKHHSSQKRVKIGLQFQNLMNNLQFGEIVSFKNIGTMYIPRI